MEREIKDFRLREEYYFTIAKNMVDHIYKDDDDFDVDLETIEVINDCITFDYEYELTSVEGYLPCLYWELSLRYSPKCLNLEVGQFILNTFLLL